MDPVGLIQGKIAKGRLSFLLCHAWHFEIVFKNGMTRYVLIKKHRNGGTYLCPIRSKATWSVNKLSFRPYEPTRIIPYSAQPMNLRYTFDEFFKAMPVEEYEIDNWNEKEGDCYNGNSSPFSSAKRPNN